MTLETQRIRLDFIDEESRNLIEVKDGEEVTRNTNQKTKQQPIDVHSVTNVAGESISSVTMSKIYCESVR